MIKRIIIREAHHSIVVSFFFYAILAFMFFLLPIFVRVDGAFSYERKMAFIKIKLYGIKVLTLKAYFNADKGIYLSINGKKGKKVHKKDSSKSPQKVLPMLNAVYFTDVDLGVYVGGAALGVSLTLGVMGIIIEELIRVAKARGRLDFCRIRMYPCYVNDRITGKISISLFTAPMLILYALAHTKIGVKNAKRSNR